MSKILLDDLIREGETIEGYVTSSDYYSYNYCIAMEDRDDLGSEIEDTLHRLIDTGADEEAGLQTLQFNSLCIRRPGFAEEARRRRSSIDDDETPDTPAPNMFQGLPPDMCPTAFD